MRLHRITAALFLLGIASSAATAQESTASTTNWVTNGTVQAIAEHNGSIYIGGSFRYVGPRLPYGNAVNQTTGAYVSGYATPNGAVHAAVPDEVNGGWYIGGAFTQVGGQSRPGLARINSNGTLDPDWNPGVAGGTVYALAVSGDHVYVGGDFASIGSNTSFSVLARVGKSGTGALDAGWDPNVSGGSVLALAAYGDFLYAGGSFTTIGGGPTNGLTAFYYDASLNTHSPTGWNPALSGGPVKALAVDVRGSLVVGGEFETVDGSPNYGYLTEYTLASLVDSDSDPVTPLTPELPVHNTLWLSGISDGLRPDGADVLDVKVNAIAVKSDGSIYVGGEFSAAGISPSERSRLAAFGPSRDLLTWAPALFDANGEAEFVNSLSVVGGTVYAGGFFRQFATNARINMVALSAADGGTVDTWVNGASDEVYSIVPSGSYLYVGGKFISVGGPLRNRLASLNASGVVTDWNPNIKNGSVNCLAVSGNTLYIAGTFTKASYLREKLAAFDLTNLTGANGGLTSWDPNPDGQYGSMDFRDQIYALAVSGSNLYVGGKFSQIAGQARTSLAAFELNNDVTLRSWNPVLATGDEVLSIAIRQNNVYVGGNFTSVDGEAALRVALFDESSDPDDPTLSTTWMPQVGNDGARVYAFAFNSNGTEVYIGGTFSRVQGFERNSLACVSAANGAALLDWSPSIGNGIVKVKSMVRSGNTVLVAGDFTNVSDNTRSNLASIDATTTTTTINAWNPVTSTATDEDIVNAIAVIGSSVYAVGNFTATSTTPISNFASYAITDVGWIGGTGNWNVAENWNPGVVPTSTSNVTIASGTPLMNVDHTVGSGRTMTISGGGSLVIDAGKRLTIGLSGTANFGGKSVTLKSTASGTASIGEITGSLTGATNVTVERYIPEGRKWRLLTAPLKGSTNNKIFETWQNGGASGVATSKGVEIWGPAGTNPATTGLSSGPGSFYSIRKLLGTSDWTNVEDTRSEPLFDASKNYAFAIYVTGPTGSNTITSGSAATTLSATGSLFAGSVEVNLPSAAGRFFLVGNPYASSVAPSSFSGSNRTNLDNILYMWDANSGVGNNLGRYVAFNIDGNTYNTSSPGYPSGTNIQSGQAFFVRVTDNTTSSKLVFNESSKREGGSDAMLGNSVQTIRKTVRVYLKKDGQWLDGAIAFFHPEASASVDAMDGVKMMNSSDNLGFLRSGRTLVFEHRPDLTGTDTLFLSLTQMQRSSYRLHVKCEGISEDDGFRLELIDKFTQQRTPLSLKDTVDIGFVVGAEAASSGNRFMIVLSKNVTNSGTALEPASAPKMYPYPNPVLGSAPVRVNIDRENAPWDLNLTDAAGRSLWRVSGVDGSKDHVDVQMSRFGSGVYNLIMTDGRGRRKVSRIVKQ